MKNLIHKYSTKRIKPTKCFVCSGDINVGDHYVSVNYSDGFTKHGFGAFHESCWEEYDIYNKNTM